MVIFPEISAIFNAQLFLFRLEQTLRQPLLGSLDCFDLIVSPGSVGKWAKPLHTTSWREAETDSSPADSKSHAAKPCQAARGGGAGHKDDQRHAKAGCPRAPRSERFYRRLGGLCEMRRRAWEVRKAEKCFHTDGENDLGTLCRSFSLRDDASCRGLRTPRVLPARQVPRKRKGREGQTWGEWVSYSPLPESPVFRVLSFAVTCQFEI